MKLQRERQLLSLYSAHPPLCHLWPEQQSCMSDAATETDVADTSELQGVGRAGWLEACRGGSSLDMDANTDIKIAL